MSLFIRTGDNLKIRTCVTFLLTSVNIRVSVRMSSLFTDCSIIRKVVIICTIVTYFAVYQHHLNTLYKEGRSTTRRLQLRREQFSSRLLATNEWT